MIRPFLALALTLAAALPASAAASSTATTISAIATQQTSKHSGKTLTFTETLTSGVKPLGHDRVTCISGTSSATCTGVFTLTRGTIRVAGKVSFTAPSSTLTVTGGTGAYRGKKGTLKLTPAGTRSLEVFTLR